MRIQTKFRRVRISGQSFANSDPSELLPDRVLPLKKIVTQFLTGRPVDSLNRNLPYNEIEANPLYCKGVDLADLPSIAKEVGETLQQANDEIERAKVAQGASQVHNPDTQQPEQLELNILS